MHAITNGILMAILAHAFIGGSLVWDKVLLRNPKTKNLPAYVFWLGAISIFGLLLMPFGFHMPSLHVCLLAFTAGVLNLLAWWFFAHCHRPHCRAAAQTALRRKSCCLCPHGGRRFCDVPVRKPERPPRAA